MEREMMDPGARDEKSEVEIPLGVRLTILFLRVVFVITVLALVFALFGCLGSFLMGARGEVNFLESLSQSLLSLGVFGTLFSMASAADWMCRFLRARYLPPEILPSGPPGHPAVLIGVPSLQVVWLYSICHVLVWAVVKMGKLAATSWAWPIFWVVLAVVSDRAAKALRRRFSA